MKKLILLFALPVGLSAQSSISVQSVELSSSVTSGSTITLWIPAVENTDQYQDDQHFTITNTSASTVTYKVRKVNVSMADVAAQSLFCTGLNCYSPNQSLSLSEIVSSQGTFDLKAQYNTAMMPGLSRVRYTIFDVNNTSDSLYFYLDYNVTNGPASVQNTPIVKPSFSNPMPNPASGAFSINYKMGTTAMVDTKLVVYNMLGASVLETTISDAEGTIRMDAGILADGVYFCTLINNGRQVLTKRLMVTR